MMRCVWLSANEFGYELAREASRVSAVALTDLIILAPGARTVMYDGVPRARWEEFGVPVHETEDINTAGDLLRRLRPDIMVMCGWRQIIREEVFRIPGGGTVGFHPTLLPCGRGSAPIINTILNGVHESGVSLFYLDKGVDSGDIIGQEKFPVTQRDNARSVYDKIVASGKKLVRMYFPLLARGEAPRIPQDHSRAVLFKKPSLKNNRIDFEHESLEYIERKIRALSPPYRGAYIERDGKRLVIWSAELQDQERGK